jgi:RimJ/RimL family protein N-acetyltransferase
LNRLKPQEQAIEFAKEPVAQIGWDFDPLYWNQGYGTEAVQGAITFAFSCLDVSAILAQCFFDNQASRRVMEKVGMQQQRLTLWQQRQLQECYQEARLILSYGLRKSHWQERNI